MEGHLKANDFEFGVGVVISLVVKIFLSITMRKNSGNVTLEVTKFKLHH